MNLDTVIAKLKTKEVMITVGLIVFAAVIRFVLVSSARFTGDEARFYSVAYDIVTGKNYPLLGPDLSGGKAKHFGPTFYYLMALPLYIWRAPEACNALVAFLGALQIGFFYRGLRLFFQLRAALLASILLACSPWTILYDDRIWNSNVVGFFVAMAFWAALKVRKNPRSKAIAVLVASCMVMPQFHMSVPMVWVGLAVLIAPSLRRLSIVYFMVGFLVGSAFYIPTLVSEIQTDFKNYENFTKESLRGAKGKGGYKHVPLYAAKLMTLDVTYHEMTGYWNRIDQTKALESLWTGTPNRPFHPLAFVALLVSLLFFLGAILYGLYAWCVDLKNRRFVNAFFGFSAAAGLALVTNLLLMRISGKAVYGHYVQPSILFYFVLYAALFERLSAVKRARHALVVGVGIFAAGGIQASYAVSWNIDDRNSIATHRMVLEGIQTDLQQRGIEVPAKVGLQLAVPGRGSLYHYNILNRLNYGKPFKLVKKDLHNTYRLIPAHKDPPKKHEKVAEQGPVALYRKIVAKKPDPYNWKALRRQFPCFKTQCLEGYGAYAENHKQYQRPVESGFIPTFLKEFKKKKTPPAKGLSADEVSMKVRETLNIEHLLSGLDSVPLSVKVVYQDQVKGVSRSVLLFDDPFVGRFDALYLRPADESSISRGMVAMHGHGDDPVKMGGSYLGVEFAKQGFAVLIPRLRAHDCSGGGNKENSYAIPLYEAGFPIAGLHVYEALLGHKYLKSLVQLSDQPIVLLGHSGGSSMANLVVHVPHGFDALIADYRVNYNNRCGDRKFHCETIPSLFPISKDVNNRQLLSIPVVDVDYDLRQKVGKQRIFDFLDKLAATP